jgi:hypothetical protein
MEPRRHRLGDVVDDYCPRERRLSNHVIVALVDDIIKQTRCTTCEFEHPYKEARVPVRRAKKDGTGALYKQVLDNVTEGGELGAPRAVLRNGQPAQAEPEPDEVPKPALVAPRPVLARPAVEPPDMAHAAAPTAAAAPAAGSDAPQPPLTETDAPADEGPVHRTLIRATLPRPEGEAREPRPIPTFTVREAATRPKFRRFRPHGGRNANGHAFGGGQPSPFTAQPRHPGNFKAGGNAHGNRAGGQGQHHGNRANRRGNKGR